MGEKWTPQRHEKDMETEDVSSLTKKGKYDASEIGSLTQLRREYRRGAAGRSDRASIVRHFTFLRELRKKGDI